MHIVMSIFVCFSYDYGCVPLHSFMNLTDFYIHA